MRRSMRKRRNMKGGWQVMNPASIGDTSMNASSAQSLAQGQDYERLHAAQHGGAAVSLTSAAPVGYPSTFEMSQDPSSRVGPLNQSMQAIQGMSDQSGGRRRSRRSKSKSKSKKSRSRSSKKSRSRSSKRRRQGGGGLNPLNAIKNVLGFGSRTDLSGNSMDLSGNHLTMPSTMPLPTKVLPTNVLPGTPMDLSGAYMRTQTYRNLTNVNAPARAAAAAARASPTAMPTMPLPTKLLPESNNARRRRLNVNASALAAAAAARASPAAMPTARAEAALTTPLPTKVLPVSANAAANAARRAANVNTGSGVSRSTAGKGGGMKFFRNLKAMFSSRKGRKGRKGQRGGAGYQTGPSQSYDAPGMLLSPAMENKALMSMNPEWRLAENPSSFAPK